MTEFSFFSTIPLIQFLLTYRHTLQKYILKYFDLEQNVFLFFTTHLGKAHGVNNINNINYSGVSVSSDKHYQEPETEAAKWNSAIINFITFPTVT